MDYTRKQVIEMILKHLNIRLSLDKIYENYTNNKYHKKVIEYNKKKGAIHPRNPWCLYMNGEPLPEFISEAIQNKVPITQWDSDCSIEMCCPLNEECDRCI